MDAQEAFAILVRGAVADATEQKLPLLDACAAIGRKLGFDAEAELVWTIAANLRAADSAEQDLLALLEAKK